MNKLKNNFLFKKSSFFLPTLFLLFFSCNDSQQTNTNQFEWIVGKWQGYTSDSLIIFEDWNKINASTFSGIGGMIAVNDTVFSERISIFEKENNIYYRADIAENKLPVDFLYNSSIKDSFIFENPAHDFPQRIVYHFDGKNKLHAYVDGKIKGVYKKEVFNYLLK